MSRINTNVQSLIAQRVLGQNNQSLAMSLERLSTGYRINRGKDDPAGLIVSENLRGEQKALGAAISNADRADQVANIAEGGLQEVSGVLVELQGLLTTSASRGALSNDEKAANQLQIDFLLQTVDRISTSTNFQGLKLLNGTLDFKTTGVAAGVTDFRVNASKNQAASVRVDVQVTTSAQQGGVFLSLGGSSININSGTSAFTIEIGGSKGTRELQFSSGTSLANIASAINAFSEVTGVAATASGTGVKLTTTDFG
jgi:flagellin